MDQNDIQRLRDELERTRFQLYFFYELTKAMRLTLKLDEITYIILTGLTAHEGLSFNRAAIFFVDQEAKLIKGFMGIGPLDSKEADEIWHHIEEEKKDLYDLIDDYSRIRENAVKPRFMEFVRALSLPLDESSGFIYEVLNQKNIIHMKEDRIVSYKNDPLMKKLILKDFLASSLWIKGKPTGVVIADNYITKKPISDDDMKIFGMFMEQATGAIENSQSFETTLARAHTDSLTSLWNYGYFQYKLDEEITKAQSLNLPLSLMMIDIDDFKKFNDTRGHLQGDSALRQISEVFKENTRKIDILCRYGGEEFALILPNNAKPETALLGERIRKSIEERNILNSTFTISVGISSYPSDGRDKLSLIEKADQALYQAKRLGKNQVVLA